MQQQRRTTNTSILPMNSENRMTKNECYRQGDKGQIPQRKRKPRLKWTKELHQHFVQTVNQLGGAYEATPKNIVKLMGFQEITTNHIKSHLQKYRHSIESRNIPSIRTAENEIGNFLQQVQCSQGKNLVAVMERIPETIKGKDNISEKAKSKKDHLYEPVTGYQIPIHSLSCLNFRKATEKNQETHKVSDNAGSNTRLTLNEKEKKLETDDTMWSLAVKKDRPLYSLLRDRDGNVEEEEAKQKPDNDSTISIGLQVTEANCSSIFFEGGAKARAEYYNNFCDLDTFAPQVEPIRVSNKSKLTNVTENGPLYSSTGSKFSPNYQSFDLNIAILEEQVQKE